MDAMDERSIGIECPECNQAFNISLRDASQGRTVVCPQGHQVKLEDKEGNVRSAVKAHDDLMRDIGGLGGTIKF
jgi:hypothetical protein